jgi:hypothetical protein
MPRQKCRWRDNRVPIGEGKEGRITGHQPVGSGNNQCGENHVIVSVAFDCNSGRLTV